MRRFWRDERGQDLVEYALLVAAVALAMITTIHNMTDALGSLYTSMTSQIDALSDPVTFQGLDGSRYGQ